MIKISCFSWVFSSQDLLHQFMVHVITTELQVFLTEVYPYLKIFCIFQSFSNNTYSGLDITVWDSTSKFWIQRELVKKNLQVSLRISKYYQPVHTATVNWIDSANVADSDVWINDICKERFHQLLSKMKDLW